MRYDVASKRLMEIGGTDILKTVAGLDVRTLEPLEELPQEQVWVTSSDFCARCTLADGSRAIVLLEFQSRWTKTKLLDMLVYAAQRMRRHRLPVVQVMVLFQPSKAATSHFAQGGITFDIHLVKIWEMDASAFLAPDHPGLWPLAALAKDGLANASKIDTLLHDSRLPTKERSDLLTIFALFLGMRDENVAQHFVNNRRELMIDSPIFHFIKDEGRIEGREEGFVEGREEGRVEGRVEMVRKSILDFLANRFAAKIPSSLVKRLNAFTDLNQLEALQRQAWRCTSIRDFASRLQRA